MWLLALRTLRYRKTSFIAAFLAILLGAAMVMACGGLLETGIRMAAPPGRFAGVPIVVTGQQRDGSQVLTERARIDADLVEQLRSVPGVARAIPDLSFAATVVSVGRPTASNTVGRGWSSSELTPAALTEGAPPAGDTDVVLDGPLAAAAGASIGSTVDLAVAGTTHRYRVTGVTRRAGDRPTAFFTDQTARRLAPSTGELDSIGVIPATGTDPGVLAGRVTTALGGRAVVLTGERRGLADLPGALAGQQTVAILAAVFGSWALLIVLFGVASTLSLALRQRDRELALLRAIGATPGRLRLMVLGESAVLSVLATAPAILLGRLLGRALLRQLADHGVIPTAVAFHEGPAPVAVGAVAAIAAALGATLVAGRRSANLKPVTALVEADTPARWFSVRRLLFALLFLAGGLSLAVVTATTMADGPTLASTAGPASVLVAIGLALLAPGITRAVLTAIRRPVRLLTGLSGRLALRNSAVGYVRTAAAVAPVVLLVGIATGTLYMQTTEDHVTAQAATRDIRADRVLHATAGGFGPAVVDRVRALPGVAGATELVDSAGTVTQAGTAVALRGVSADGLRQTIDLDPVAGSLDELRGNDAVALSDRQAAAYRVHLGDSLPLRFGDGDRAAPHIVALFADRATPNREFLLLPAGMLAAHTTAGLPSRILITATPGADSRQLDARLGELAASLPGATVAGRQAITAGSTQIEQILASSNYTIVAMIVGYAAITVVNSLLAVTRKRRAEFGLQRLTGATRAQVLAMLGVEGALIAVIATVLGTAAAAATVVPYSLVRSGSPIPSGPLGLYPAIVLGALALILAATLLPSWRGMRGAAIDATGDRI